MFFEILFEGLKNGFFWLPFVLGVGLLYKNMKIIDVSIDGIAVVSIISFVASWNFTNSLFFSIVASIACAVICYMLLSVFIYEFKINAIFAGIIFSLILYAISVIAIGESLPLRTYNNYAFVNTLSKYFPFVSMAVIVFVDLFFRTKRGIAIRVVGENENANTTENKRKLLLYGFILTGFLVGYGAFGYAIKETVARSGGGFDFVVNSLASFLLVDKFIDFIISKYKKKNEEKIVKYYYLFSFLQNSIVKAFLGSIMFQILVLLIIAYTQNPVYWKLFFGIALILTVAKLNLKPKTKTYFKSNAHPNIIIDNIDFAYNIGHENKIIFKNFSSQFNNGINIIRGANGVGKTTLLKIINNELTPESGKVLINGNNNRIFYLRQEAVSIFAKELTVYENVINILPRFKYYSILGVNHLISVVNKIIAGYGLSFDFLEDKSIWVKKISHLSGGQIQKIACMMALISDCGIILADEPSSGLDYNNIQILEEFFYKLSEKGKIIVIVSHDSRLFGWKAKNFFMYTNKLIQMFKNQYYYWFEEDYGFFGDFYYIADNSNEGPYDKKPLTREERTLNEVSMIIRMLNIKEGDSVFDCPCGWGRHAIPLANEGVNVTAIDINRNYIHRFKENLSTENKQVRNRVKFLINDMRNIDSKLPLFDYGINMFNSFGFFNDAENLKTAENFCNILKPKGKMLIHLDFNSQRLIQGIKDYSPKRNIVHEGKKYSLEVEKQYHYDDKKLHGKWTLKREDGTSIEKTYAIRIYDENEMTDLLKKAGFKNVLYYSSDGSALTTDSIDTVIVAEK